MIQCIKYFASYIIYPLSFYSPSFSMHFLSFWVNTDPIIKYCICRLMPLILRITLMWIWKNASLGRKTFARLSQEWWILLHRKRHSYKKEKEKKKKKKRKKEKNNNNNNNRFCRYSDNLVTLTQSDNLVTLTQSDNLVTHSLRGCCWEERYSPTLCFTRRDVVAACFFTLSFSFFFLSRTQFATTVSFKWAAWEYS